MTWSLQEVMLTPEFTWGSFRANLLHLGFVVDDIERSVADFALPGETAPRQWSSCGARNLQMTINAVAQCRQLRISHSTSAWPNVELIAREPDSPWEMASETQLHHVCFWSDQATALCLELELAGERILGRAGDDSGYFRLADGRIVEIVSQALARSLYFPATASSTFGT